MFGTQRRRNPVTGTSYAWLVRESVLVNHFYFYGFDDYFGPFFLKFCSYFPYTARLCCNGNEYAKRQAAKAGIGFTPLDNAFAAVSDVTAVQAIATAWTPGRSRRWPASGWPGCPPVHRGGHRRRLPV